MKLKFSIFSIFLLMAVKVVGQPLPRGTFVLSTGFTHTEFSFKDKLKFDYKYVSCTGGQEGSGTYRYRNGELSLFFEDIPNKQFFPKPDISRINGNTDSLYLTFNFYNPDDSSGFGPVLLEYTDKQPQRSFLTRSTEKGEANVKFHHSQLPVNLSISCIGVDPETITFNSPGAYSIDYPVNFNFIKTLCRGQVLKFIILDFDDEEIELKPVNTKEYRIFTRKEE